MSDGSSDINRPLGPILMRVERKVQTQIKMTSRAEAHTRAIIHYINRHPDQLVFSAAEIAEALGQNPKRVFNTLDYLVRRGDFVRDEAALFRRSP